MTGITAGDDAEQWAPSTQRIRPESAPEPPEVNTIPWTEMPGTPTGPRVRLKPPKDPRRPALGLPVMIVFSLISVFFSWVSAEPFWLAIGHGSSGTLTITQCAGSGWATRCEGQFSAPTFDVDRVALTGASDAEYRPGDQLPGRVVSAGSRVAYAGDTTGLHLRWAIGFGLVLLCGFGITWATGSMRLQGASRIGGVALSFGVPLLLLAGILAVSW